MPDVTDILSQYIDTAMSPMDAKVSSVAAAAEQKKAELDPQGYLDGAARDIGYGNDPLNPAQPINPIDLIARAAGDTRYMNDASRQRSMPQAIGDSFNSGVQSLFMTIPEIANIPISAVSPGAGASVNRFIQDGLNNAQAKQSDGLNDRRKAYAARGQITGEVNQVKYNEEVGKDGKLLSGLRRIGRDAIDSISNTDGVLASDLIANAAGSLATAGPVGKAVGFLGKAAMPVSIGLQEAGGVHHQTMNDILNMSDADLAAGSADYRDAISQSMSPDEARNYVARNAGLEAAAIQFPIAAATGALVGKFEKAPLKPNSLAALGANSLKETVEEGIQSGTGQLAQNIATQDNANENQDLLAGVGEQAGLGALGGLGSAGMTAGPGAVLKTAVDTVKGTANLAVRGAKAVAGQIDARVNDLTAANQKASPVSDENVRTAVDDVVAVSPDVEATVAQAVGETKADDASKASALNYVSNLVRAAKIGEDELTDPNMPTELRDTLAGSAHRLDAMQRLAGIVEKSPEGSAEQLTAAATLYNTMGVITDALEQTDVGAINELPDGHPAKDLVDHYETVLSSIGQSASVSKALGQIDAIAKAANESGAISPVDDATVSTPSGQQTVRNAIAVAEASPQNANPEANDQILRHAEAGKVQLTPAQRVALQTSSVLVRAERARLEEIARLGLKSNQDIVSEDITIRDAGQDTKTPSVAGHVKRIVAAARTGNQELAATYLTSFLRFAQHMQNKVGALNEALTTGANGPEKKGVVHYKALLPNGNFRLTTGKLGAWVNPYAPNSVKLAQQVAADARIVAQVANDLVSIFPDLGMKPVDMVELNKSLNGPAEEVSKSFREGRADSKTETNSVAAPKQEQTATPEPAETGQPEGGDKSAKVEVKPSEPVVQEIKAETKSEPAPAVETKQEASPATEDAPAQAETPKGADATDGAADAKPEPKKSVDGLYPKLPSWSLIKKAFKVSAEAKTRILGMESPLSTIKQALSSAKALQSFIGSDLKHDFTEAMVADYGRYLGMGDSIKAVLAKRLADSKELARFTKGEDRVVGFRNGRALSLVNEDLTYNDELIEGAVLAALQWLLVADRFQSPLDRDDVAELLGDRDLVPTDELVKQLNEGLGQIEAKRSLANMVRSYWGLSAKSDAPIGQTEGLPEALAGELLHALIAVEGLKQNKVEATEADGLTEKRTFHVYLPIQFQEESPLMAFPTAIEQAVLTEPENVDYIGEAPKKVANTQLRNPDVKLTEQQKDAIRFEQKQPHFVNLPMANLFTALGLDNVLKLFAAGDLSNTPLNAMDKKSKEGRNRTFGSAYMSLVKLMAEVRNKAAVANVEVDQLPIHYDYAFTRVNRMQMLGLNNPQASKLMREAVLPTKSTIDLSNENSEEFSAFALGLAQALGIKVHNQSREATFQQVSDLLAERFEKSVEILQNWLKDQSQPLTAAQVETLKSELAGDASPVALHALTEFARYQNATAEERKAFTTSLYVEADGVTNGPVNAMVLLTPGRFNLNWLRNVRKGGLFPGATRSMNEHRQIDGDDLYTDATNNLLVRMADLTRNLKTVPEVDQHMTALSGLMELFLPDATVNDDGELEFKRGIAKNPMTITIYGSGAKGIAGKVSGQLVEAIYERLSAAMQEKAKNKDLTLAQAMFGGDDAQEKFSAFAAHFKLLTRNIALKNRQGYFVELGAKVADRTSIDPATFEIKPNEFNNLRQNMLTLFVNPMREAIRETIGDELLHPTSGAATILRQAVQVQSIFLQYAYQAKIQEKLAEKAKDPEWNKDDFLSRDELKEIWESLSDLAPIIETGAQNYYIAGSQRGNVAGVEFGSSLGDDMRTPAQISAPADAGVAGIPSMVIGSGDGMMMQILSTMDGAPDRTLKVFDGMHLPLDNLVEGSQKANQAVFESWMGNPLAAVSKSYTAFLEAVGTVTIANDEMAAALDRALDLKGNTTGQSVEFAARAVGERLQRMADQIEARHKALARVGLSVDQMAAVGAPYIHEGDVSLEGLSDEQVIAKLNELAREEALKIKEPKAETKTEEVKAKPVKEVSENIAPELESVGRLLKSGARVVSHTALKKLVRSLNVPAEHKALLGDVIRTLAAKEYKIVYGSPEQVQAYADERGLDLQSDSVDTNDVINGFIIPSQQTIYLHNPSSETLVHELIHAATFDKIQAYYDGESLGPNAASQVQAIERLEGLMNQFLGLSMHSEDEATQKAFFDATDEIEKQLDKGNKAAALNEFMAWGLSNAQLQKLQKKTASSQLVQMARKIVLMIKQLVAGKRQLPAAGEDMFSNLRFNTNVLLQTKFDARKRFAKTVMFHSTSYGNSTRLVELNRVLNRKIIRHLRETVTGGSDAARNRRIKNEAGKILSSSDVLMDVVDRGFTMNAQERTTFQLMVSVLGTAIQLDPNAITRVQDLYAHVVKNLHVDDFLADEDANDPAKQWEAEQKVNLIVGDLGIEVDGLGRSSLLPVFLALATTNDQFRAVLAKMEVPKSEKRTDAGLDAKVENASLTLLDGLTAHVSGEGQKQPHIQGAIDALIQRVMDTAEDRESFFQQKVSPIGNAIDRANEIVTDAMQKLAETTVDKADDIKSKTNSMLVKALASAAKGIAGIADERTGGRVAEGIVSEMNRHDVWKPIQELISDIIGRTESNASIYDMIKVVRDLVQQRRQQFREHLPKVIYGKFSRKVTDDEWSAMHHGLGKTDLAALRPHLSKQELNELLSDPSKVQDHIEKLEKQLAKLDSANAQLIVKKAKQLAHFMNTGEYGNNLLRNAKAVANLFNEGVKKQPASDELISTVDQLTTLYAYDGLEQVTKDSIASLAQTESDGVSFVMDYLVGQRKDELAKTSRGYADVNHYKGAMPVENQDGLTLLIANDRDHADLVAKSFVRVGSYAGSNLDKGVKKGYYFAPMSGRSVYNQGILQNVRQTAYGLDLATGGTHGLTAGRIDDPAAVKRITQLIQKERATEPLSPLFDSNGQVIAYERTADPKQLSRLKRETNLAKSIGNWRGRQLEELEAQHINEQLIDRLHEMYERDIKTDPTSIKEYVDLRDPRELKKDAVLADAVKLFSSDTHGYIDARFGKHFYVRRDMLNDALGYHSASVSDLWTKTSRVNQEVLNGAQKVAMAAFGNQAYRYMVTAEKTVQNLVSDARILIVVKSVVVPVTNMIANTYQLWARGVPINDIVRGIPRKTAEVNAYLKSRLRLDEAEAELRTSTDDPIASRKLEAEMQSIRDSHRRMSIWPLIEAGEFSSISDGTLTHDDLHLTEGRLSEWIEKKVDQLPPGIREAGRYAIISRDTALFQALQRSVEYGDFLAKAVLYDHLTQKKKLSRADAVARISEEFVNYDRLPGRSRGYLESMGVLWFWNFKIRSVKVALSTIRNNPVHALMAGLAPHPELFGSVGSPVGDNLFSMAADGDLGWSIGPGMGLRSHSLNPWLNLLG